MHMNADALNWCINTIISPEDITNEDIHERNSDKMNEYNDVDKQRILYEYYTHFQEDIKERKELLNGFD